MDTTRWGPQLWSFLFTAVYNYDPKTQKQYYKRFFYDLRGILPCIYCRESFTKYLKKIPIEPYLHSTQSLLYWLYLVKDQVNTKENAGAVVERKATIKDMKVTPPFKAVCQKYAKLKASCSTSKFGCRELEGHENTFCAPNNCIKPKNTSKEAAYKEAMRYIEQNDNTSSWSRSHERHRALKKNSPGKSGHRNYSSQKYSKYSPKRSRFKRRQGVGIGQRSKGRSRRKFATFHTKKRS